MARCYLPLPAGSREDATSETGSTTRENEVLETSAEVPLVNGNAESKEGSVADKVSVKKINCLLFMIAIMFWCFVFRV